MVANKIGAKRQARPISNDTVDHLMQKLSTLPIINC